MGSPATQAKPCSYSGTTGADRRTPQKPPLAPLKLQTSETVCFGETHFAHTDPGPLSSGPVLRGMGQ